MGDRCLDVVCAWVHDKKLGRCFPASCKLAFCPGVHFVGAPSIFLLLFGGRRSRCYPKGCAAPGKVQGQCNARGPLSKLKRTPPRRKINVTIKPPVGGISAVTLKRTDTTLDHSQKAEKVWQNIPACMAYASAKNTERWFSNMPANEGTWSLGPPPQQVRPWKPQTSRPLQKKRSGSPLWSNMRCHMAPNLPPSIAQIQSIFSAVLKER